MDRGKSSLNGLAQFPCGLCNPPLQGLQGTAVARCASHSAETSKRLNSLQNPGTSTRNRMVSPDCSDGTLQWKFLLAGVLEAVISSPNPCTLQQAASYQDSGICIYSSRDFITKKPPKQQQKTQNPTNQPNQQQQQNPTNRNTMKQSSITGTFGNSKASGNYLRYSVEVSFVWGKLSAGFDQSTFPHCLERSLV